MIKSQSRNLSAFITRFLMGPLGFRRDSPITWDNLSIMVPARLLLLTILMVAWCINLVVS